MNCRMCRYWEQNNKPAHPDDAEGYCRRYAPAPRFTVEDTGLTLWPTTWGDMWCGDYEVPLRDWVKGLGDQVQNRVADGGEHEVASG